MNAVSRDSHELAPLDSVEVIVLTPVAVVAARVLYRFTYRAMAAVAKFDKMVPTARV